MKSTVIAILLSALIALIFAISSRFIPQINYEIFVVAFVFGLSFSLITWKVSAKSKNIDHLVDEAVRKEIERGFSRGGFIKPDQSTTDIEACRKRHTDTGFKGFKASDLK